MQLLSQRGIGKEGMRKVKEKPISPTPPSHFPSSLSGELSENDCNENLRFDLRCSPSPLYGVPAPVSVGKRSVISLNRVDGDMRSYLCCEFFVNFVNFVVLGNLENVGKCGKMREKERYQFKQRGWRYAFPTCLHTRFC